MIAYALNVTKSIEIPESFTYNETNSSDEAAEWTVVMTEEMESLHKNQTWELVKLSRGQKLLDANESSRKKKKFQVLSL